LSYSLKENNKKKREGEEKNKKRKSKKKRGRGDYRSKKKHLRGRCLKKAEKLTKEDSLKKNRRQQ
jgi:hypothetical protein